MSLADTITSIVVCRGPRPLNHAGINLISYSERNILFSYLNSYLVKSDISIIIIHISLARTTMSLLLSSHLLTSLSKLIEVRQKNYCTCSLIISVPMRGFHIVDIVLHDLHDLLRFESFCHFSQMSLMLFRQLSHQQLHTDLNERWVTLLFMSTAQPGCQWIHACRAYSGCCLWGTEHCTVLWCPLKFASIIFSSCKSCFKVIIFTY